MPSPKQKKSNIFSRIYDFIAWPFRLISNLFTFGTANLDSVTGCDEHEQTLLHLATRKGNFKAVMDLIKAGANVDALDGYGQTPLQLAYSKHKPGFASIVLALLEAGANPNVVDKDQLTPLHLTAHPSNLQIVLALINAGANTNAVDNYGHTPLHLAVDSQIANALIGAGANVKAVDNEGRTPLHLARNLKIATVLINAGASINAQDKEGRTPLHSARNHEIVTALINAGASLNAQDKEGRTPLHWAAEKELPELVGLLNTNIALHGVDDYGATPLHRAALRGNTKTAVALTKAGANKNAFTNSGYTPLGLAVLFGQTETVTALIGAGADVNEVDEKERSPLHVVSGSLNELKSAIRAMGIDGEMEIISEKIQGFIGGSITLPLLDKKACFAEIALILIRNGAYPNAVYNSFTPLRLAARNGYTKIVETLLSIPEVSSHESTGSDLAVDDNICLKVAVQRGAQDTINELFKYPEVWEYVIGHMPLPGEPQNWRERFINHYKLLLELKLNEPPSLKEQASQLIYSKFNGKETIGEKNVNIPPDLLEYYRSTGERGLKRKLAHPKMLAYYKNSLNLTEEEKIKYQI